MGPGTPTKLGTHAQSRGTRRAVRRCPSEGGRSGLRSPQSLTRQGWKSHGLLLARHQEYGRPFHAHPARHYYAEKQIVQALPEMIEKSTDAQLKQGFQSHLRETENHVKRLEKVFHLQGKEAKGVDCPAIDGIIEEAEDVAGEVADKSVLDAALIAAAQAVEHYEITRYGSLVAWAKELGRNDCATLLQQNLDEEKAADKKLTAMAESKVNRRAA